MVNSFKDLGVSDVLCKSIELIKWNEPREIQIKAIPPALEGKDIVATAKTGSGKTAAFTIPIIEGLIKKPSAFFALILTPTRDLAQQIQSQLKGLGGTSMNIKVSLLIGGFNEKEQKERLQAGPHVIVATPGRFLKHLSETKGFNKQRLQSVKMLVIDEADKMLGEQFKKEINTILFQLPMNRQNLLFSATNTSNRSKLTKVSLKSPVMITVDEKFANIEKLTEYVFITKTDHEVENLVWFLRIVNGMQTSNAKLAIFDELDLVNRPPKGKNKRTTIIFVNTILESNKLTIFLNDMGFKAKSMNGDMSQEQRTASLDQMKAKKIDILVATNVIARGIDINNIDIVLNFKMCDSMKDYTHRIGRTARSEQKGVAILLIYYDEVDDFLKMQDKLGRELINMIPNDSNLPIYRAEYRQLRQEVIEKYQKADDLITEIQAKRNKRKAFNITDYVDRKKRKQN